MRGHPPSHDDGRRPPGEAEQDDRGNRSDHEIEHAAGEEVHADRQRRTHDPLVEIASHAEIVGQLRPLEMADALRAHPGQGQAVVEMRRHAVTQVGAHHRVHGKEHHQQDETDTDADERRSWRHVAGDGRHQPAKAHRKAGRQHPPDDQQRPPRERPTGRGAVDRRKEPHHLSCLRCSEPFDHSIIIVDGDRNPTGGSACAFRAGRNKTHVWRGWGTYVGVDAWSKRWADSIGR